MPQNPAPAIRKNLVENFKVHGALYLIFKYFASLQGIRMRCLKVSTRQCRERSCKVFRWSIAEQNHFRSSFFVKLSCHLLLEIPILSCFSLRAPVALWGLDHTIICQVCVLVPQPNCRGLCSCCPVHSTKPRAGTSSQGWGGGRGQAHPNPAEALIVVETLILTGQLPAQWDPKLPALRQKQEQGFSTSGILGTAQAHIKHIRGHNQRPPTTHISQRTSAQNQFTKHNTQHFGFLAQGTAFRFLLQYLYLQEALP